MGALKTSSSGRYVRNGNAQGSMGVAKRYGDHCQRMIKSSSVCRAMKKTADVSGRHRLSFIQVSAPYLPARLAAGSHARAGANITTNSSVIGDENFVNTAQSVVNEMFAVLDYGDAPPYATPSTLDGGTLACYDTRDAESHPEWFYDLKAMEDAADNFCFRVTEAGLKWAPADTPKDPYDPDLEPRSWFENPDIGDFDPHITTSMMWLYGNSSCPTLDLSSEGAKEMCMDRLHTVIHNCKRANLPVNFRDLC